MADVIEQLSLRGNGRRDFDEKFITDVAAKNASAHDEEGGKQHGAGPTILPRHS
jgi:hypothetical protein